MRFNFSQLNGGFVKKVFLSILLPILLISTNIFVQASGLKSLAGPIPIQITQIVDDFKGSNTANLSNLPRGILLVGRPGSGKTTLGKALSNDIQTGLFIYQNAPDLDAKAIKAVFKDARAKAKTSYLKKCIIFIDEFDTFGFDPTQSQNSDTRDTVITLLNEMDGFESDDSVLVIAATQFDAENYDKSLTRSGRFDTTIKITLPNQQQRVDMITFFKNKLSLSWAWGIDWNKIGKISTDFTPADIKKLVSVSFVLANRDRSKNITEKHLGQAIITVIRANSRTDKKMLIKLKLACDLLNNTRTPKGFARFVGPMPNDIKRLVSQIKGNDPAYASLKIGLPKGILLVGPPGTGKTTIARAISEETNCEFVAISAAEFSSSYVGSGGQKIRDLFNDARELAKNSPSGKTIIFIDEIDSIGKRQGSSLDSTVTSLLTEMDGFEEDDSIIVLAATNHPGNLDSALLRAGRFSKKIKVGLPDLATRKQLLTFYTKGVSLTKDVNLDTIAQATNNTSPADLKEIIEKAKNIAITQSKKSIDAQCMIAAIKQSLQERILKGEKDIQQQIESLDVIFNGKTTQNGFKRLAGSIPPEIEDLVKMIKGEVDYKKFGLPFPKGILLAGPPGTGKTALVRALSEEAGCEFVTAKGSSFINLYVGVGADNVRKIFEEAKTKAEGNRYGKTILFIDEIDAIGSRSSSVSGGGETQRTIAELLAQMDGFYQDDSVIVIAATNVPDALDPALRRAGRFDTTIEIPLPDLVKRQALLQHYIKNRPIASVSVAQLATKMDGFNAADIKETVNAAALLAMRAKQSKITQANLEQAIQARKNIKQQGRKTFI